jgi:hypothetical protein
MEACMNSFRLAGLDFAQFAPLFELDDPSLAKLNARRMIASESPGFPCRVSLTDAQIGEETLLLPYRHQPANSPYNASGPIFVRKAAVNASIDPDVIPPYIANRLLSLRAYDAEDSMVDAAVAAGKDAATTIRTMFDQQHVTYLHLHNANRGCFLCRVDRA